VGRICTSELHSKSFPARVIFNLTVISIIIHSDEIFPHSLITFQEE